MARNPRFDILFEPVRIGPVTAPNRFYQVPHASGMTNSLPQVRARFRGVKAEGGRGVVCTGAVSIHPSSDDSPLPFASLCCGGVHPELCAVVPSIREAGGGNLDWNRGIPHRDGAYTFTHSGSTARRAFPGLGADEQVRHKGELVYPNVFLSVACDHVAAFILRPRSAERTDITCHFLFEPHAIDQATFDPSDAVDFWDLVNRQDWTVCEAVQQGIGARVHTHGYYAPMEDWNLDIRRYVTERIDGHVPP